MTDTDNVMHRKYRSRRQESPESDSEGEYNRNQQRHGTTTSKGSVKRTGRHQSPPISDLLSRGSRPYRRSQERTSNYRYTPRYRTASEEDSSNDRHHKERSSGYRTKSAFSGTKVERLQSPRVSSTRQNDRRDRTCRLKSPPHYYSGKYRMHSDSSSSSDNKHRAFDRAESKRCHNGIDGDMKNTCRRMKMMRK